jgi:hypothetical protein
MMNDEQGTENWERKNEKDFAAVWKPLIRTIHGVAAFARTRERRAGNFPRFF